VQQVEYFLAGFDTLDEGAVTMLACPIAARQAGSRTAFLGHPSMAGGYASCRSCIYPKPTSNGAGVLAPVLEHGLGLFPYIAEGGRDI